MSYQYTSDQIRSYHTLDCSNCGKKAYHHTIQIGKKLGIEDLEACFCTNCFPQAELGCENKNDGLYQDCDCAYCKYIYDRKLVFSLNQLMLKKLIGGMFGG